MAKLVKTAGTMAKTKPKRTSSAPKDGATGAVLERRVREAPKDASARMVYADWLEQNDEGEMAAFIRAGGILTTLADAERQVVAALEELFSRNADGGRIYSRRGIDLRKEYPATRPILDSPQRAVWLRATLAQIVDVQRRYRQRGTAAERVAYLGGGIDTRPYDDALAHLKMIASEVLRAKPALSDEDVVAVLDVMSQGESLLGLRHQLPWAALTGAVERFVANDVSQPVIDAIERTREAFFRKKGVVLGKDDLKIRERLEGLLE